MTPITTGVWLDVSTADDSFMCTGFGCPDRTLYMMVVQSVTGAALLGCFYFYHCLDCQLPCHSLSLGCRTERDGGGGGKMPREVRI